MKFNRINKIQELLEDKRSISINKLCDIFEVSKTRFAAIACIFF